MSRHKMNLLMEIYVTLHEQFEVRGHEGKAVMISFSAKTEGELFTGRTVMDGCDTQFTDNDGAFTLSARYMLEGKDFNGEKCRLFIENNGTSLDNCKPRIITNSAALAFLEKTELSANVECVENGVIVRIYRKDI